MCYGGLDGMRTESKWETGGEDDKKEEREERTNEENSV